MGKYNYKGLSSKEVQESIKTHGKNELPPPEVEGFWDKLKDNFNDPLIKILMVALLITIVLAVVGYADWIEGIGIAVAVFLATFVATMSEYKNEESFRQLQEKASRVKNNVFRNSQVVSINVTEIVQGDYVLLEAGDKIPADGVLIEGTIKAFQAPLNGEPEPLRKNSTGQDYEMSENLLDPHLLFRGALVSEGDGVMLVKIIGENTLYGKLLKAVNEAEERSSPLKVKLENLADGISTLGYIGASFIFLSFLFKQFVIDQGFSINNTINYLSFWQIALKDVITALILSIIIIVVAVPEGLPMMIAIVLSINMKFLLDQQVLVRRLLGIETAGSLNVLFSDKTGTITCGLLEPHNFVTAELNEYNIHKKETIPENINNILSFCIKNSSSCHSDAKGNILGGNSSDRAFMSTLNKNYLSQIDPVKRINEIIFSSEIKFSAVQLHVESETIIPSDLFHHNQLIIVKGAPERLLPNCRTYYDETGHIHRLTEEMSEQITETVNRLSDIGIRVIAFTTSQESELDVEQKTLPRELTLVGCFGLRDEIRDSSKSAIDLAVSAGIQVIMITGDRKETAISIAKEIGLIQNKDNDKRVLTSEDLKHLTDAEIQKLLPDLRVIARALPSDKARLVEICKALNLVVGMTGDGVNDAAALKNADVGFAMGSGTEMAKEAADIVILDDNFNSITRAVLYGRTIFKSIRKFIIFQSTINVASTLIVFLGPFLRIDFPLTLIQLLWVNLVMDTLAALAFGGEPALTSYMKQRPIPRETAIISPYMWSSILIGGFSVAFISLGLLFYSTNIVHFFVRDGQPSMEVFFSAFFGFYIFITTINAFNVRTKKINLLDNITRNRGFFVVIIVIFVVQMVFTYLGGNVLRTVPLTLQEWGYIFAVCFIIIPIDLVRKMLIKNFNLLPKKNKKIKTE